MYQFSRSLYRDLGPLVVEDRYGTAWENRQHFLQSCEAAFKRLASDRHYFARPACSLFNDVRVYFPMQSQLRVYQTIAKYMTVAAQYVDEREREGISLDGSPLCCHASTRKVARTALIATAGFTDLEELGRQARSELYRLCERHPSPLVPPELRIGAEERCGPDGVIAELDEAVLREGVEDQLDDEVEAVAV